ncbi:hypothetical protein AAG906_001450 [Vitis piasezkii]
METKIPCRQLFIDGEWVEPIKKGRIPIVNPAIDQIIGDIPAATGEDVELAVDAARRAFARNKGRLERKSELAKLEAIDSGKPLDETTWDIDDVASCFEYFADHAEALDAQKKAPLPLPMETFKNYPLLLATWKVAPALAAGCAAILKPSELASVGGSAITGLGTEAGAPLASHPHVDKISFTGSPVTGSKIMTAAAQLVKPVSLELGGKSPILVFEDVDLDKAAEWTAFGCFWTNGQICSATSRLLVQESIAAEFLDKLVKWTKNIKISDPLEEGCKLGPVVSRGQYEKLSEFISTATSEGGTILCGGGCPQHLKRGFFIEPTIISDVTTSMQIWREEVFGPVLCVKTFSSEDEAIELANDSSYALAGAVISDDLERCDRVSKALNAGIVWVNCSQPCFYQAPWGGNKRSGFGRELGPWGLDNYLNVKQVTQYISNEPWGWYQSPSKL